MNALEARWIVRHFSIFGCVGDRPETDIIFIMKTPSAEIAEHIVTLHNNQLHLEAVHKHRCR